MALEINDCLKDFIDSLVSGRKVIFVNNPNSLTWEYHNYITLAKQYDYRCEIIEIDCPTPEHVNYFNERCYYKVSLPTSKSLYDRWEKDSEATVVAPYDEDFIEELSSFPGDSLPYPKRTLEELDDELDTIATKLRHKLSKRRSERIRNKSKSV